MEQIKIDLVPNGVTSVAHASQFDVGRSMKFLLTDEGVAYTLAGTEVITMKLRKPDGTDDTISLVNTSSSYVEWTTVDGDLDLSGVYLAEITITSGDDVLGTANFLLKVEIDPYGNGKVKIMSAHGSPAFFNTDLTDNAVECKLDIAYSADGYTSATAINSKTAPVKSTTPYLIKETPSGNGELDKLIGGTVAFNQIIPDASMHETGTGTGGWILLDQKFSLKNNHVYLCLINGTFDSECLFRFRDVPADIATDSVNGSFIYKATTDTTNTTGLQPKLTNGVNYDFYYGVIDLTAMFGSTIADYVYTLENS